MAGRETSSQAPPPVRLWTNLQQRQSAWPVRPVLCGEIRKAEVYASSDAVLEPQADRKECFFQSLWAGKKSLQPTPAQHDSLGGFICP